MKTIGNFKIMVLVILFIIAGCEDFIEADVPDTQITGSQVFKDAQTAEAALQETYIGLRDQVLVTGTGTGMGALMGLYTDELQNWRISNATDQSFYTNTVSPANNILSQIWNNSYTLVYNTNKIVEGLDKSDNIPDETKQRIKGEALVVRSMVYFYMAQLFGDIPYIITTDHKVNSTVKRTPQDAVYQNVVADLQSAAVLLEGQPVGAGRTKINSDVTAALLGRVHLCLENWEQVIEYSDLLILNGNYKLEEDLDKVFLKESTGTVWHLKTPVEGNNTHEGRYFIFNTAPPPSISLTEQLVNAFDPSDLRKEHWIKSVEDNQTNTFFHAFKYKERQNTASSKEYSVVFRLEEAYYNRMEAYLNTGRMDLALADWNLLRMRYGMSPYTAIPGNWKDSLMEERRFEFFCEFGFRFFDLKRTRKLSAEMIKNKPLWLEHFELLPLPQTELLLNPNLLPQNEGY
ncbi:MAG: RagB/SusD family nutrient uptake outer membrane protein [Myroides sp.]|nr:RagB/SusD family nutrient uptake outer membrane protein [Myroides sp.]